MGLYNSMLNIMPWNCRYCHQGFKGMQHISDEANQCGLTLIEAQKNEANKGPIWEILESSNPIFVNGVGHGSTTIYTGDDEHNYVFSIQECSILAGRVIYLNSCYTAVELGPESVSQGAIAYAGYKVAWAWFSDDLDADPYDVYHAEPFWRSSNEFPISLIRGYSVEESEQKCIAEYDRWIEIYETERVSDPIAAEVIKFLISDRDGLTVFGDKTATVASTSTPTVVNIEVPAPSWVNTMEAFEISGRLVEKDTLQQIADRTIELRTNAEGIVVATTVTDENGNWTLSVALPKGNHYLYVLFPGDTTFSATYSEVFRVDAGTTSIKMVTTPKLAVEVNEQITLAGILQNGAGQPIPNKTIRLSTGLVTETDSSGYWRFTLSFNSPGRNRLVASFSEDMDFVGSKSPVYRIKVGSLYIFGNNKVGNYTHVSDNMFRGSRFAAPECTAHSIVAYLTHNEGLGSTKARGVIYRVSDMKLIAITETRGDFGYGWMIFVSPSPIYIEAGEYLLLIQFYRDVGMRYKVGEADKGGDRYWPNFGDPPNILSQFQYNNREYSVYCEYTKEETMDVTFAGAVSAQANENEEVKISVIKPDSSVDVVLRQYNG
jgi:hypothetical protein